eukprot:Hpha_TRINITY_DN31653_c0_g1::TRINITY_DN31653_c0_g1_i1::g.29222::m.29222
MEGGVVPIRIPEELAHGFRGLANTHVYFIDYVLRVGRRGKKERKVVAVTAQAVFECGVNGDISRCIPLRDVDEVIAGGVEQSVALVVPTEGQDQMPSYDLLFRTGNLHYVTKVLKALSASRRAEAFRAPTRFSSVGCDDSINTEQLRLHRPRDWEMRLDPEIMDCVANRGASSEQVLASPFRSHPSPPRHNPADPPPPLPAAPPVVRWETEEGPTEEAVRALELATKRGGGGGGDSREKRKLLRKLESLERELKHLRTERKREKHREKSYSPKALLDPTAIWGDLLPSQHTAHHASIPPHVDSTPAFVPGTNAHTYIPPAPSPDPTRTYVSPETYPPSAPLVNTTPSPDAVPAMMHGVEGHLVPPHAAWKPTTSSDVMGVALGVMGVGLGVEMDDGLPSTEGLAAVHRPPAAPPLPPPGGGRGACCWCCGADLSKERTLPRCSGCRAALYCGRSCQLAHWPEHSVQCLGPAEDGLEQPSEDEESDEDQESPSRSVSPPSMRGGRREGRRRGNARSPGRTQPHPESTSPVWVGQSVQPNIIYVMHGHSPSEPPPARGVRTPAGGCGGEGGTAQQPPVGGATPP